MGKSLHSHDRHFFKVLSPLNCYWGGFIASKIERYEALKSLNEPNKE